jgi:hypothetical protein
MLKITVHRTPGPARLTLEGRLAGPWIDELERAWSSIGQSEDGPLVVDLTEVTFIAEAGKTLLSRMWREGVALVARGCCTRHVVDEITNARLDAAPTRCETK